MRSFSFEGEGLTLQLSSWMIYIITLSHVHANNTFLCHNVLALNSLFFLGKLFCYKPAFVILSYRFKVTPFSQKNFKVAQIEISNTKIYMRNECFQDVYDFSFFSFF